MRTHTAAADGRRAGERDGGRWRRRKAAEPTAVYVGADGGTHDRARHQRSTSPRTTPSPAATRGSSTPGCGRNDPVHWHAGGRRARASGRSPATPTSARSAGSRSCSARAARGVMMAEADEMGLATQRQMMLVMDPPAARPLQAARQPRLHAPQRQTLPRPRSRSWPARSSTTSSSAASATSCTTSPGGCRRA